MFQRFSEQAVKAIMVAQEETRRLGHNFVGTEQILLGLIGSQTGVASLVLASMGVNLENARREVENLIGRGSGTVEPEIPFTPRAKAALDAASSISLELDSTYIGTEHLLLGIVQEGERIIDVMGREPSHSAAFQVLQNLGVDPLSIRNQVMQSQQLGSESGVERFSIQSYRELLRTLLPPTSNQALQVLHAIGGLISWEETDISINLFLIKWVTKLTESEMQAALAELIKLGVIARIETA